MIFKIAKRKRDYTQILNSVLRDRNLSAGATGVLAYLLSHDDDWEARISDICERFNFGPRVARRIFRKLRALGYAVLTPIRDEESGRWGGKRYLIFETPRGTEATKNGTSANGRLILLRKKNNKAPAWQRGARDVSFGVNGEDQSPPVKLANRFKKFIIKERLPRRSSYHWKRHCENLLEREDYSKVKEVMLWYFDHWKDVNVTTCQTLQGFCDNFVKIQKAMERSRNRNGNGHEEQEPQIKIRARCINPD